MIVNTFGIVHAAFEPDAMSLDRKDPKLGYISENVVLCTFMMNTSKGQRTDLEFIDLCRIVAARFM